MSLGERLLTSPWRWCLLPAWLAYRPLVRLRDLAFDRGWRHVHELPVPVICVGNLASGGTGKTPLVALICELLQAEGRRPRVVSRGYRATDAAGNDEARLMPVPVHCDPDRVAAGRAAIAAGADCLVMDDGFQHRRLHRDLDIVCIDATRPWGLPGPGWGGTLPLGLLREGRGALRRAGAIVVTRSDQVTPERLDSLQRTLAKVGVPVWTGRHVPEALVDLTDGSERPPTAVAGPVLLVSAIGNHEAFAATARGLGWSIVDHLRFADHHHFRPAEQGSLLQRATAAGAELVMTAKDATKWTQTPADGPRVAQLRVRFGLPAAELAALRDRLKDLLASRQKTVGRP